MRWNVGWWKLPNLGVQDNWTCQIDLTSAQDLGLAANLRLTVLGRVDSLGRVGV